MDQSFQVKLKNLLEKHEGKRNLPYLDTATPPRITIGIGRNLTDRGLSDYEVQVLFQNDVNFFVNEMVKKYPWFESLSENRQVALVDMAFNMGMKGFGLFKGLISCLQQGDWKRGAAHILNSKYAKQVPNRAREIANIIATDEM